MKGSTYRRCYCRDPESGRPLGKACPQLSSRKHGSYSIRQELPARPDGSRRSFNRAGYATAKAAQDDLDKVRALLGIPEGDDHEGLRRLADALEQVADEQGPIPDFDEMQRRFRTGQSLTTKLTLGDYLDEWIAGRKKLRDGSARSYAGHIRLHIKPRIGHVTLPRLRVGQVAEMFADIAEANDEILESNALRRAAVDELAALPWKGPEQRAKRAALREQIAAMPPFRKPVGPSTMQRIRATLRKALNDAITRELITFNAAAHVELDSGRRPKPVLWSAERVDEWQRTGTIPSPVMVWTPQQTGAFLDHVQDDDLYALFHVIAYRGLRRGEACGVRWVDCNLDAKQLRVTQQLVQLGWTVVESAPKSDAGERTVPLDTATVQALRSHRERQDERRRDLGDAWVDSGRVFTGPDGSMLHPAGVTRRFKDLVAEAELPPIRLHDLRHGAATLAHAAGADMKDIQALLGHSSIAITADTYTSVLPELAEEMAEAVARLVPRSVPSPDTAAHASLTQSPGEAVGPESTEGART